MNETLDIYRRHMNAHYLEYLERNQLNKVIVSAEGSVLTDSDGKQYVDFVAGYGCHNLGHNPPEVIAALQKCLADKPLWNRPFLNPVQANAIKVLCDLTGRSDDRVFLCSTGAEAVDTAIKLARIATGRTKIIAAQGSFHGFTLGALSVSGIPAQRRPFEPLLPGVDWLRYGDPDALSDVIDDDTAAVLLEPVQAEIGAIEPPQGYLTAVQDIASRSGALLIVDEVRTGLGRTGPFLACEREGVEPDILVLGKSLGSGVVPVSAVLSRPALHHRADLSFSMSASSFAGHRLAATAALATLGRISNSDVLRIGKVRANTLWDEVGELANEHPGSLSKVTGQGMLVGLHFNAPRTAQKFVSRAIEGGILVALAFCDNRCVLLEPPLTISESELRHGTGVLKTVLDSI